MFVHQKMIVVDDADGDVERNGDDDRLNAAVAYNIEIMNDEFWRSNLHDYKFVLV